MSKLKLNLQLKQKYQFNQITSPVKNKMSCKSSKKSKAISLETTCREVLGVQEAQEVMKEVDSGLNKRIATISVTEMVSSGELKVLRTLRVSALSILTMCAIDVPNRAIIFVIVLRTRLTKRTFKDKINSGITINLNLKMTFRLLAMIAIGTNSVVVEVIAVVEMVSEADPAMLLSTEVTCLEPVYMQMNIKATPNMNKTHPTTHSCDLREHQNCSISK